MLVSSNGNVNVQNAVQQSIVYSFTKKRSIVLSVIFPVIVTSPYSLCYVSQDF